MSSEIVVPDIAGEIIGFRAWRVIPIGRKPVLQSVTRMTIWPSGQYLTAACDLVDWVSMVSKNDHMLHGPPGRACSCGIYAAKSRDHLLAMNYHKAHAAQNLVVGDVALIGKVIPGEQGWRAEKARPIKLYVPLQRKEYVKGLQKVYGIEVVADPDLTRAMDHLVDLSEEGEI